MKQNSTISWMKRNAVPLTREDYNFFNWLGTPPDELSAEELSELPDELQEGPYGESNRTASAADTHYSEQKVGLMPEWTWNEGRKDSTDYNPYHAPAGTPEGGQFTSGEGGGGGQGEMPLVGGVGEKPLDPVVIDVGGDEWNKQTAVRLEREYQQAKPELEKLASAAVVGIEPVKMPVNWNVVPHPSGSGFALKSEAFGYALNPSGVGEAKFDTEQEAEEDKEKYASEENLSHPDEEETPYVPESWDEVGNDQQEEIKNDWIEKTADEFLKSEIDNWSESGDAMDDTKNELAYKLDGHSADNQYAFDALNELHEERQEAREKEIPFTNEQLMDAMKFEYETGYQGSKDVEISWDEDKLTAPKGWVEEPTLPGIEPEKPSSKLTKEMRSAIEAKLVKAFNDEADNKVSDTEPPEYLKDNIEDYQSDYWDSKTDKEKFEWAGDNGHIETAEKAAKEEPRELTKLPDRFDPLGERDDTYDYKLTKLLGSQMSIERSADVLMRRGIFDKRADALRAANTFENRLWTAWKGDSASTDGLILQAASAAELGGRFRSPTAAAPSMTEYRNDADQRFGSAGGWDGVKAYVRAKWETSQYLLDKAGMSEVKVYRGILLKDKGRDEPTEVKSPDYPLPFHYNRLPDIVLHRNGAQSATTDPYVANKWKGIGALAKGFNPEKDRVVFRMRVPRTAVLSLPAYGQNMASEHEVVLAGTAWKRWDAWHQKAPTFAEAALDTRRTR
jgi:hypothetical protein